MGRLVSRRELSRIWGVNPSYVITLCKEGYLTGAIVKDGSVDGKIDLELANKLREENEDPSKDGVRAHHAKTREGNSHINDDEKDTDDSSATDGEQDGLNNSSPGDEDSHGSAGGSLVDTSGAGDMEPAEEKPDPNVISFANERAKKEHFAAKEAELNYLKKVGALVSKDAVQAATYEQFRIARNSLLAIPDNLNQVLAAETDPIVIHELLIEEFETVLTNLSDGLHIERATG